MLRILDHIEQQMEAMGLPVAAVTVAAVPCPDTPVILSLHWQGLVRERISDSDVVEAVAYAAVPSSALQLNERWGRLAEVELAALQAAWRLGAWDLARVCRPSRAPGPAASRDGLEYLQGFGAFPFGVQGHQMVVADAPDAEDLLNLASRRGHLMWVFRPVRGGICVPADDVTLRPDGTRAGSCPVVPAPVACDGSAQVVYRLGQSSRHSIALN